MLNVKSQQTLTNVVYYLSVDSNILSFIITNFVLLNQITKLSIRKNIFMCGNIFSKSLSIKLYWIIADKIFNLKFQRY